MTIVHLLKHGEMDSHPWSWCDQEVALVSALPEGATCNVCLARSATFGAAAAQRLAYLQRCALEDAQGTKP